MRERLTKKAMGKNDSPTTMEVPVENPPVSKYETGDPESWAEGVNMDHPWDAENKPGGREDTGHAKKVRDEGKQYTYASAVREAQELENKALRCLKMAEVMLGDDAPTDVIERQAVDFMTMSGKSVYSTLRRMREFEEIISEARVAKVVDAVMEVMAEDDDEKEEEETASKKAKDDEEKEEEETESSKKAKDDEEEEEKEEEETESSKKAKDDEEEDEDAKIAAIVEATLQVLAEDDDDGEEEKKEEKAEEASKKAKDDEEEDKKEDEETASKKSSDEDEDAKIAAIVEATLKVLAEDDGDEEEEKKEEKAEEASKKSSDDEEEEEDKKEEEKKEEKAEEASKESTSALDVTFDEVGDVMASAEDEALLAQIFSDKEATEEVESTESKDAKIQTLKSVTASKDNLSEIDYLSSLWKKY